MRVTPNRASVLAGITAALLLTDAGLAHAESDQGTGVFGVVASGFQAGADLATGVGDAFTGQDESGS
ncbi:hypothetical protein ABZ805_08640 [Saccharopolyspora sp. NPDC047091]|uniref:hypothetical protein n=1 Tax=Saccharopolyspora sp. NPDC047091 TaxID=3155924 RepID=UPI0033F8A472